MAGDRLDEGFQGRGERVGEAGEGEGGGVGVLDVGAALLDEVEKIA